MTEGKCKAPWCDNNAGGWIPGEGYCCILHRSMHEAQKFDDELNDELDRYAGKAFELKEEVERLTKANEEYRRAIFNLYAVQGLGPGKVAEASWQLWKLAGVPEEDFTNVPG